MRCLPILPPLLAALAAACGGARDRRAEEAGLEATLASMRASLAAVAAPAPAVPVAAAAVAVRPAPTPPEDPPAPPPAPPPRPSRQGGAPRTAAQLLGQDDEHLRRRLGEPVLRRREGSLAEIWLYAVESCALDVVLYRDRAGVLRVGFAAARAAGEEARPATEAECLDRVADGPMRRPAT